MVEVVNSLNGASASANRRLFQAYQSWQNKKFVADAHSNLIHLFSSCEESKLIPKLVQLPWSLSEQDGLVNYLMNVSNVKSAKLQAILCLLLNGKLDEAQRYKDFCVSSSSSSSGDDDDDDLFQSGMLISALIDSYAKNFPHSSLSSEASTNTTTAAITTLSTQDSVTPRHEKFHSRQDTQTPFTDSSIMNESVRRRRSRKTKDHTPMPSHPMLTRASTKKKSLGQH